jgi:hypothetical protein
LRRLLHRVVTKSKSAPVTGRAVRAVLDLASQRLAKVTQATRQSRKPVGARDTQPPTTKGCLDWARRLAKDSVEYDVAAVTRSDDVVEWEATARGHSQLATFHEGRVADAVNLMAAWAVPVPERRLLVLAANAQLDAARRELERTHTAKTARAERDVAMRTRHRGGGGQDGASRSRGLFGMRLILELPPANAIPSWLHWLEPHVSPQHRFWLSWTGVMTAAVLGIFVLSTMIMLWRT